MNVYIIDYRVDQVPLCGDDGMVVWFENPIDVLEKVRQLVLSRDESITKYPINVRVIDVENDWYAQVVGEVLRHGPGDIEFKVLRIVDSVVEATGGWMEQYNEYVRNYRRKIKRMETRLLG